MNANVVKKFERGALAFVSDIFSTNTDADLNITTVTVIDQSVVVSLDGRALASYYNTRRKLSEGVVVEFQIRAETNEATPAEFNFGTTIRNGFVTNFEGFEQTLSEFAPFFKVLETKDGSLLDPIPTATPSIAPSVREVHLYSDFVHIKLQLDALLVGDSYDVFETEAFTFLSRNLDSKPNVPVTVTSVSIVNQFLFQEAVTNTNNETLGFNPVLVVKLFVSGESTSDSLHFQDEIFLGFVSNFFLFEQALAQASPIFEGLTSSTNDGPILDFPTESPLVPSSAPSSASLQVNPINQTPTGKSSPNFSPGMIAIISACGLALVFLSAIVIVRYNNRHSVFRTSLHSPPDDGNGDTRARNTLQNLTIWSEGSSDIIEVGPNEVCVFRLHT
uniref:Uncharacterized protein n=1 Tax=Attheya septentrionalis TaxID=420275 RepID=A0A7S2UCC2_9STRA|mmetsp:Transcript_17000/g.30772  ORF Transcript_17000/g.30772 Transcript_17000/m.30772 type:complete len:389 (+) Transcript_17000:523-1689(+)